jgi:hypothetical protein
MLSAHIPAGNRDRRRNGLAFADGEDMLDAVFAWKWRVPPGVA